MHTGIRKFQKTMRIVLKSIFYLLKNSNFRNTLLVKKSEGYFVAVVLATAAGGLRSVAGVL